MNLENALEVVSFFHFFCELIPCRLNTYHQVSVEVIEEVSHRMPDDMALMQNRELGAMRVIFR